MVENELNIEENIEQQNVNIEEPIIKQENTDNVSELDVPIDDVKIEDLNLGTFKGPNTEEIQAGLLPDTSQDDLVIDLSDTVETKEGLNLAPIKTVGEDAMDVNEKEDRRGRIYLEYEWYDNFIGGFIQNADAMATMPFSMGAYMLGGGEEWDQWQKEHTEWMAGEFPSDSTSPWAKLGGIGPQGLLTAGTLFISTRFPQAAPYIMNSYAGYMATFSAASGIYQAKRYEEEYLLPNNMKLSAKDEWGIVAGYGLSAFFIERLGMKYFKGMVGEELTPTNVTMIKELGDSWLSGNRSGLKLAVKKVIQGFGIEGTTEATEQIVTDFTDFLIYDPEAFVLNDILDSILYGGIMGAGIGGFSHTLTSYNTRQREKAMANEHFNGDIDALRKAIGENADAGEIKLSHEYDEAYNQLMTKLGEVRFLEKVNQQEYSEEELVNEYNKSLGVVTNKKQVIDFLTKDILDDKSIYMIRKDGYFEIDNVMKDGTGWSNDTTTTLDKTRINISPTATDYQIKLAVASVKFLQGKASRFLSTANAVHFLTEDEFKKAIERNNGKYSPGIQGFFSQLTPGEVYIKLNTGKKNRTLGSIISTFAHETLHNRDFRKWDAEQWRDAFIVKSGPNKGRRAGDPAVSWDEYRNVKGEDRAFSIGETAQKAYIQLADGLKSLFGKGNSKESGNKNILDKKEHKEVWETLDVLHSYYQDKNIPTSEFVRDMMEIFPNKDSLMPWLNEKIDNGDVQYDSSLLTDVFKRLNPNLTNKEIKSTVALIQAWAENLSMKIGRKPSDIIGHYFRSITHGNKKDIKWSTNGRAFIEIGKKDSFADLTRKMSTVFRRTLTGQDKETIAKHFGVKNGKWTKKQERDFANSFLRWLRGNDKSKNKLNEQFEDIRKHLYHIYRRIKGTDIDMELTNDVREVFRKIVNEYDMQGIVDNANTEVANGKILSDKIKTFWTRFNLQTAFDMMDASKLGIAIKSYWGMRELEFATGLKVYKRIATLLNNDKKEMRDFLLLYETPGAFGDWVKSKASLETMKKGVFNFLAKDRTKREAYQEAARILDEYFTNAEKQLKDLGVIKEGYVDNLIQRLEKEIDVINRQLKDSDKLDQATLDNLKLELKVLIEDLHQATNNLNYVHIPVAFIFEKLINKSRPEGIRQLKNYVNSKKRKSFSLNDLLDNDAINKEDINLHDVLFSYSRRLGQDIALGRIVAEAKNSGHAVKLEVGDEIPFGFIQVTAHGNGGPFANHWISPMVNEFVSEFTRHDSASDLLKGFDKFIAYTKMRQFIDPRFLVFYNAAQMAMAGSLSLPRIVGAGFVGATVAGPIGMAVGAGVGAASPKWVRTGLYNYFTKNEEYRKAETYGLSSTPYPNPYDGAYDQFKASGDKAVPFLPSEIKTPLGTLKNRKGGVLVPIYDALFGWGGRTWSRIDMEDGFATNLGRALLAPKDLIDGVYNLSYYTAWSVDQMQRHISYAYMKEKHLKEGKSDEDASRDAAQQAALFHGDYASVPWKTRNFLNKMFFTPTYKIIMARLLGNMIKGVVYDAPVQVWKTGKIDAKTQINASGIFRAIMLLQAIELFFMGLGFERNEWGRSVKKKMKDKKGQTKEQIVTYSLPPNTFLRYWYRWDKVMNDPSITDKYKTFLEYNSYEFHPIYKIMYSAWRGEDSMGNPIGFLPGANSERYSTQKRLQYSLREIYKLTSYFDGGVNAEEEFNREAFRNDMKTLTNNDFFGYVAEIFSYPYMRDLPDVRKAKKLNMLDIKINESIKRWEKLVEQATIYDEPIPWDMQKDFLENLIEAINEVNDATYEYEPSAIFSTLQDMREFVPESQREWFDGFVEGNLNIPKKKNQEGNSEQNSLEETIVPFKATPINLD